jgi:hypothetical protein
VVHVGVRQCLSSAETRKKGWHGWLGGLSVTARAGGQQKSMRKSQGKGKHDVWDQNYKSLHHFFTILQELESELPECVTMSFEMEVGILN